MRLTNWIRGSIGAAICAMGSSVVSGQVVLDGTLGPAGPLAGPTILIPPEVGQIRGANLFHSFSQLNVAQGEVVGFTGPNSIHNILARVTGGSPSNIDGTFGTTIPDANLFLINPAGIVFGPNASIVVGGSFIATTANFVRFTDGTGRFDASTPADTVLSSAMPAAFGFLTTGPGDINVNGSFLVAPAGKALSLVGRNLTIRDGILRADGGRVDVVGALAGEVALDADDVTAALNITGLTARGDVQITNTFLRADGDGTLSGAGGRISIVGNVVTLAGASAVFSNTAGAVDGQPIDIDVFTRLHVNEASSISTSTTGTGRGGDINVRGEIVDVSYDNPTNPGVSFISTFSQGPGRAGDVRVDTTGSVRISSVRPGIATISTAAIDTGAGGDVRITTPELTVNGSSTALRTSTSEQGGAPGGDVIVHADRVNVTDGASIIALSAGNGVAGRLDLTVSQSLLVSGTALVDTGDPEPTPINSLITTTTLASTGGAKGIRITAPNASVHLADGGRIDTQTFIPDAAPIEIDADTLEMDNGQIIGSTSGPGAGGLIDIGVRVLDMDAGSIIRSSSIGSGNGGQIVVNAAERVRMGGASEIGTFAGGDPNAKGGSIDINTVDLEMTGQSILTTGTVAAGDAGPLNVNATRVKFSGTRTGIASPTVVATANSSSGVGGRVQLTATESITLEDGARVSTSAGFPETGTVEPNTDTTSTTGVAGDAILTAPLVRITGGTEDEPSRVTSSTNLKTPGTGGGGNVRINAGTLELTNRGLLSADTRGAGAGGNVEVVVDNLLIDNATVSATSSFEGDAGAGLTAGVGGSITLTANDSANLRNNALVSVEAAATDAGNIKVTAIDRLRVTDSRIVTRANGTGGDITLGNRDPQSGHITPFVIVLDNAELNANAVRGSGGNIRIISQEYVTSSDTVVTATSEKSNPGQIDVSAAYTELAGGLVRLPGSLSNEAARLKEQCGVRMQGEMSSFVTTGRGGSPLSPEGRLPSFDLPKRVK